MKSIPVGTLIKGNENPAASIKALAGYGFECFSLMFWENLGKIDVEI